MNDIKLNNAIDSFLDEKIEEKKNVKTVYIEKKGELVERVDKTFITADGRQLLREIYR